MAVGRIGDLINGEHYGQASNLPWAIQYVHPAAPVPSPAIAYHAGGLYEVLLALAIAGAVWLLRDRLKRPGELLWLVIGLYGAGRFAMFYYRVDSEPFALGLDASQWISLALVAVSVLGFWVIRHPASKRRVGIGAVSLVLLGGGLGLLAGCYSGDEARASGNDRYGQDQEAKGTNGARTDFQPRPRVISLSRNRPAGQLARFQLFR